MGTVYCIILVSFPVSAADWLKALEDKELHGQYAVIDVDQTLFTTTSLMKDLVKYQALFCQFEMEPSQFQVANLGKTMGKFQKSLLKLKKNYEKVYNNCGKEESKVKMDKIHEQVVQNFYYAYSDPDLYEFLNEFDNLHKKLAGKQEKQVWLSSLFLQNMTSKQIQELVAVFYSFHTSITDGINFPHTVSVLKDYEFSSFSSLTVGLRPIHDYVQSVKKALMKGDDAPKVIIAGNAPLAILKHLVNELFGETTKKPLIRGFLFEMRDGRFNPGPALRMQKWMGRDTFTYDHLQEVKFDSNSVKYIASASSKLLADYGEDALYYLHFQLNNYGGSDKSEKFIEEYQEFDAKCFSIKVNEKGTIESVISPDK